MGYSEKLDDIFEGLGNRYGDTNLFTQRGRSQEDYANWDAEYKKLMDTKDNAYSDEEVEWVEKELEKFHRKTMGKYK